MERGASVGPGGLGHPQRIALRLVLDLVCVALAAEQAGGARGYPEMERPAGHLIRHLRLSHVNQSAQELRKNNAV